tara:strand:+ start:3034 stop:3282 length:249 start_codon:yes stop_codon:yes gene_type:complete
MTFVLSSLICRRLPRRDDPDNLFTVVIEIQIRHNHNSSLNRLANGDPTFLEITESVIEDRKMERVIKNFARLFEGDPVLLLV